MTDSFSEYIVPLHTPPFKVTVHPSAEARAVIINIPGYQGHIDGFNEKYLKIGQMVAERGVGAYVQMPNRMHEFRNDPTQIITDVQLVIKYAKTTPGITAAETPEIYLSGTSIGAAAAAAVANTSSVTKVLLVAPSYPTSHFAAQYTIRKKLAAFTGELYIVIGDQDELYLSKAHERYESVARRASKKEVVVIPDCDHYFTGKRNGMILSKAPLWAFAGDTTFPSPEGGLELYE